MRFFCGCRCDFFGKKRCDAMQFRLRCDTIAIPVSETQITELSFVTNCEQDNIVRLIESY